MRKAHGNGRDITIERVLASVEYDANGGCWLWAGSLHNGYATLSKVAIHRWMVERALGRPMAPKMFACHRCNVSCCINPSHLYEGTAQDNAIDRVRAHGPNVNRRKGTKITIEAAREIFLSNDPDEVLAKRYGLRAQAVKDIKTGRTWRPSTAHLGHVRKPIVGRQRGYKLSKPFMTVTIRRALRRKAEAALIVSSPSKRRRGKRLGNSLK